jgi:hypothetical protein
VGCNAWNADLGRVTPQHLPDDLFAQALASNGSAAIHRAEYVRGGDSGGGRPRVDRHLHPSRHRRGADPPVFPHEINDAPAAVSLLHVRERKGCYL